MPYFITEMPPVVKVMGILHLAFAVTLGTCAYPLLTLILLNCAAPKAWFGNLTK